MWERPSSEAPLSHVDHSIRGYPRELPNTSITERHASHGCKAEDQHRPIAQIWEPPTQAAANIRVHCRLRFCLDTGAERRGARGRPGPLCLCSLSSWPQKEVESAGFGTAVGTAL